MSNPVTVIFNNVEEFVAELREACKDRPRPEVVRLTHRHTPDRDLTRQITVVAGFVTDHGPVPEVVTLRANCGAFMFDDNDDPLFKKVSDKAGAVRGEIFAACNELGLTVRGGAYVTEA